MRLEPEVLHEDQDVVVLNKPAGVVVNEAESVSGQTIQQWMGEKLKQRLPQHWQDQLPEGLGTEFGTPEEIFTERKGMVHRLDKDTSGVLVWAKHPGSLVNLLAQFRERRVTKEYLALVHGKFAVEHDVISAPLGRASRDRTQFAVVADGRPAVTEYQVEAFFPQFNQRVLDHYWPEIKFRAPQGFRKRLSSYQSFSLVRCWPKTGRTHQIRVHLAHSKHPIVGDQTYVGKKRQKLDAVWCPRQFLHAAVLTFTHPRTGESLRVEAVLPPDLSRALEFVQEKHL